MVEFEKKIIERRKRLGSDGHFVEDVASEIAAEVAEIRGASSTVIDAAFKFSFDLFDDLRQKLGEKAEIVGHAVRAGIHSSEEDRLLLERAKDNLSALRETALKLKLPDSMTLGDKIKQLTTPTTAIP